MQVKDVGEFRLINMLAELVAAEAPHPAPGQGDRGFRLRLSIGDDAAAWDGPAGTTIVTTDTLVEGVHFQLAHAAWRDLGWKAMAVNLSDVAAMGCAPLYSVITLGLRGELPVDGLLEMYRGMLDACRRFGGALVGGDVVSSPAFFVTVAMTGAPVEASPGGPPFGRLLERASARPGDKIAVTGHLGCSAGGLRMLLRGLRFEEATALHLAEAHQRPAPRVSEGMVMAREGVACAIDVSDGLLADLGHVCEASGVGAVVHAHKLPADEHLRAAYPKEWPQLALAGGEDYELVFTAPPAVMERVAPKLDAGASVIGDVVEGPPQVRVLDERGRRMSIERTGWDHFR